MILEVLSIWLQYSLVDSIYDENVASSIGPEMS